MSTDKIVAGLPDDQQETIKELVEVFLEAHHAMRLQNARKPRADLIAAIEDKAVLLNNARSACAHIMSKFDSLPAQMSVINQRGQHRIVLGNMPETRELQAAMGAMLWILLQAVGAEAYWIASEVWTTVRSRDDDEERRKMAPSDDPDRGKGVMAIAASKSFYTFAIYQIKRERNGVKLVTGDDAERVFEPGNPVLRNLFDDMSDDSKLRRAALAGLVSRMNAERQP